MTLRSHHLPRFAAILLVALLAMSCGAESRHPDRVILITDPYSRITSYYEFKTADISYVEEMVNLVDIEGETVPMARVWVKKKSIGARASLFIVDDTTL